MVQAMIKINEHQDRILNIVKGKFGLKNKSEAVSLIIEKYESEFFEPELRPEFINKIKKIEKSGKFIKFKSVSELRKKIEGA